MITLAANAGLYGLAIFVAGFVFGAVREFLLMPRFGAAQAGMIMFAAVIVAATLIARWVVTKLEPDSGLLRLAGLGLLGAFVLALFDTAFAMGVLGYPAEAYLRNYDLNSGSLLPIGLLVVALAPLTIKLMDRAFGKPQGSD